MAELLSDEEIDARLAAREWRREGDEIVREWKFEDFAEAMAFVNRVAEAAEAANHHPDILVHGWNKVQAVADQPLGRGPDRGRLRAGRQDSTAWPSRGVRLSSRPGPPARLLPFRRVGP